MLDTVIALTDEGIPAFHEMQKGESQYDTY